MSLDHGELNVLNRTKNIDRDLDRYFCTIREQNREDAKRKAADTKALRERAKRLVEERGEELAAIAVRAGVNTRAGALKKLRSDAHWEPEKVIGMVRALDSIGVKS